MVMRQRYRQGLRWFFGMVLTGALHVLGQDILPDVNHSEWDLGIEYNVRHWGATQSIGLCDEWSLVCDMAAARTQRARATRKRAANMLQKGLSEEDISTDEIPILGFPVAFDPHGLTLRLIASIDFPVKRLVLVLSGKDPHLQWLAAEAKRMRPDLIVIRAQVNLGCAGGWNEVFHTNPDAPWWLISSYDVAYPPGTLKRIALRTGEALRREKDWLARGRTNVFAPGVRTFAIRGQLESAVTFPTFAITRRALARAGLFDENFWPAYAEDLDYFRRLQLVGGSRVGASLLRDGGIEVIHGPEDWKDSEHYSGIEQHLIRADKNRSDYEKDPWRIRAPNEITIFEQLKNANNYHFHFCQKYGPLLRPGNCTDNPYAALGPFGWKSDWADWVLDPWRRVCSTVGYWLCFYNVQMLQPWRR